MNTFGKSILALSVAAVFGVAGYKAFKSYTKTKQELDKKDQDEEKELNKSGLTREAVRDFMVPKLDDKNLVKKLYVSALHNPEFDIDTFDIDKAINGGVTTVHVRQDDENRYLEFLLEIPSVVFTGYGNYRIPTIGNYVSSYSSLARELGDEVIKFTSTPHHNLEGYYVLTEKVIDGKEVPENEAGQQYLRIPKDVYKSLADHKHDGLTKYIEQFHLERLNGGDPDNSTLTVSNDGDLYYVEDVVLMSKISIPIQQASGPFELGVNLESATRCLKYILDNLEVKRNRDQAQEGIRPTQILFHSWNGNYWDMLGYYEEESNGEITSGTYTYRA